MTLLNIPALEALKNAKPAPPPDDTERQADPERCDLHEIPLSLGPPPPFRPWERGKCETADDHERSMANERACGENLESRALMALNVDVYSESRSRRRVRTCCPCCYEKKDVAFKLLSDDERNDFLRDKWTRWQAQDPDESGRFADALRRIEKDKSDPPTEDEIKSLFANRMVHWDDADDLVIDCPGDRSDATQLRSWVSARCLAGCTTQEVAEAWARAVAEFDAETLRAYARIDDDKRREILEAWSVDKLASPDDVAADPIVDGILYARNLTMVYGTRGSRKTMSLIARAISVAAGIPWLGREVKQGLAVLVLQEGDRAQLREWIERIARGLGVDLQSLHGRLIVYPSDLRVDVDESWEAFRSQVQTLQPVHVGIDNLTRVRAKATGNSANDPAINAALMDRLEKLARGGPAVELLHHANAHGDPLGSQVPGNVADLEFRIVAAGADNESIVTMRLGAKNRPGKASSEIRFRFRDRDDGALVPELAGREAAEAADEEPALDRRRERMLELVPDEGAGLTAEDLYQAAPWTRRVTKAVRDQLEAEGTIVQLGGRWRRT